MHIVLGVLIAKMWEHKAHGCEYSTECVPNLYHWWRQTCTNVGARSPRLLHFVRWSL